MFVGGAKVSGVFMRNVTINISGKSTKLFIGRRTQLKDVHIVLTGEDSSLYVAGTGTNINNASLIMSEKQSCISIDEKFTMEGGLIRSRTSR